MAKSYFDAATIKAHIGTDKVQAQFFSQNKVRAYVVTSIVTKEVSYLVELIHSGGREVPFADFDSAMKFAEENQKVD